MPVRSTSQMENMVNLGGSYNLSNAAEGVIDINQTE